MAYYVSRLPLHRCYKMARNRRLALALALADDEEENHVPARLWVQDITRGRQQQGAYHHLVQELRFDEARFAAYCDWSVVKKKRPMSGAFILTVELFPTFFYARYGRTKCREAFKKTPGMFSKNALLHRNINKTSAGRKQKTLGVNTPLYCIFLMLCITKWKCCWVHYMGQTTNVKPWPVNDLLQPPLAHKRRKRKDNQWKENVFCFNLLPVCLCCTLFCNSLPASTTSAIQTISYNYPNWLNNVLMRYT